MALAACAFAAQPITNGTPTAADPAVIALVDDAGRVTCTATMIGPHTAITAAHCIEGRDPRTLSALFGASVADGTRIAVSGGRVHPMFDPSTLAHDIAVLTLREASPVPPVELDTRTLDGSLVGTTFRVVGYGNTAIAVGDSGTKRDGTARISEVNADELVAVPDPSQPCRGDSGGPALLSATAIAAVVSRGDAMCADHATYSRIDVARAILVDPYLAETAAGTAALGTPCLYDGHCAEGACVPTADDPLAYVCSNDPPSDAGCGCSSGGSPLPVLVLLAQLGLLELARRRPRNRVDDDERVG